MPVSMGPNRYGKDGIRLVLVRRGADEDELRDLTVDVRLEGDFDRVHTDGDNSGVLPTDTMRSTVYALAQDSLTGAIEDFGAALAARFLDAAPAAGVAEVTLREHAWGRATVSGEPHPHTFIGGFAEGAIATVTERRGAAPLVRSGIAGLTVLKTTGSAFSGFMRDEFTVLAETEDRILASEVTADWTYLDGHAPAYAETRVAARRALLEAFATHESKSVQHTLYAMGEALLAACADVCEVSMRMPNKHHIAVDLSRFGIDNDRAVFVATDRPFGVIEGTVTRG
ncbi:MAG: urate oxidase [Actinomycetota bacterium]|jgi:urate oxidase|nr:urate oxidase [Actinomycetota bacterium]MDQ1642843.1 urate oxidase [Actinomycetota bacterium]